MNTCKFKSDCSERWKNLVALLPDEDGEIVSIVNTDNVNYYTVLFPTYGEVYNIPEAELVL